MTRRRINTKIIGELRYDERKIVSDVVKEYDSDFRVKTGSVPNITDIPPELGVMVISEHDGNLYYADINGWNQAGTTVPIYRYNGIDNYHYNDEVDFLIAESSGSIKARFYWDGVNTTIIFSSSDTLTNTHNSYIMIHVSGKVLVQFNNTTEIKAFIGSVPTYAKGWHIVELQSDGDNYSLYMDGASVEFNVLAGEDNGMWFGDVPDRDNISIGALIDDAPNFDDGAVQWVQIDDGVNGDWHYNSVTNTFDDRSVLGLDLTPVGTWT